MPNELNIPAAERTLRLIELLMGQPDGWSPQELLLELDLSRSSLFVLLRALKALGYVDQSAGKRGRYSAGPRLLAWKAPQPPATQDLLSAFYQEAEAFPAPADPAVQRETLALVLPAGAGYYQVAAQVECSALVRIAFTPGLSTASLPAAERVLSPHPAPEVAASGYALENDSEALTLALPVCRDGATPEAALLLSAPAYRWTDAAFQSSFLEELREMAAHLSYRLGAPFYAPYSPKSRQALQRTAPMSRAEITAFLKGPYAARLACIRPDGRPHVIPVWQEWDGQDFYLIAWQGSQWAEYIQANPNISLSIDEPWAPLRRVAVSGRAAPVDVQAGALDRLVQRMTRRYLGHPAAPGMTSQVQCAYRVHPDTLRGWQGLLREAKETGL